MAGPSRVLITGGEWNIFQRYPAESTSTDPTHQREERVFDASAIQKLYHHSYPPALHNSSSRTHPPKIERLESGEFNVIVEDILEWARLLLVHQDVQPSSNNHTDEAHPYPYPSSTQLLKLSSSGADEYSPTQAATLEAEYVHKDTNTPLILWVQGEDEHEITSIAHRVAQTLQDENRLTGAYFFDGTVPFPHHHSLSNQQEHENSWIATLAYQMSLNVPETKDAIVLAVSREPGIFDLLAKEQIRKLIVNPLLDARRTSVPTGGPLGGVVNVSDTLPISTPSRPDGSVPPPGVFIINGIHHAPPNDEAQLSIIHNLTMALKTLHLATTSPKFPQKVLITTCTNVSAKSEHLSTRFRKPYVQEVSWHVRIPPPSPLTDIPDREAEGDASGGDSGYLDYFTEELEGLRVDPETQRQFERFMMHVGKSLVKAVLR